MSIRYFRPYLPYNHGIVKRNFISNTSKNILVDVSSCTQLYPTVYPSAVLQDDTTYYQPWNQGMSTVNITFEKAILLSHFSFQARAVDNMAWHYPNEWTMHGCMNDVCTLIAKNTRDDLFNQITPKLVVVTPGVFHKIMFRSINTTYQYAVIRRLEFFGYTCDKDDICNGRLIHKSYGYQKNWFNHIHFLSLFLVLF